MKVENQNVEQIGSGMNRMMKSYSPDIFQISPNFFHVVLFFNAKTDGTVNGGINDTVNDRLNDRLNENDTLNDRLNDRLNENGTVNGGISGRINENGRISDRINLTDAENDVLKEIIKNPYIKTDELVNAVGLSIATISRVIKSLRDKNIITRQGSKKTGHWEVIQNADEQRNKNR